MTTMLVPRSLTPCSCLTFHFSHFTLFCLERRWALACHSIQYYTLTDNATKDSRSLPSTNNATNILPNPSRNEANNLLLTPSLTQHASPHTSPPPSPYPAVPPSTTSQDHCRPQRYTSPHRPGHTPSVSHSRQPLRPAAGLGSSSPSACTGSKPRPLFRRRSAGRGCAGSGLCLWAPGRRRGGCLLLRRRRRR